MRWNLESLILDVCMFGWALRLLIVGAAETSGEMARKPSLSQAVTISLKNSLYKLAGWQMRSSNLHGHLRGPPFYKVLPADIC